MKIKVIQLNVWLGQLLNGAVEFIEREEPDVVMLQEVTKGGDVALENGIANVFERLESSLGEGGYEGVFMPMWKVKEPTKFQMGLAVFSRLEVVGVKREYYFEGLVEREEALTLGRPGSIEFPGALLGVEVKVDGDRGNLELMTTHFVWSLYPKITSRQIKAAQGLLETLERHGRLVLAGDFNVTDESSVYRQIKEEGLIDDRPPGLRNTLHPRVHKVGGKQELAVDYVFHKGEGIRCLNSSVELVEASDHLPVIVEYEIE